MLSRVVCWRIKDDDDDGNDVDAEARFVLLQMAALLPHQAWQATAEEWALVLGVPEAGLIPRLRQLAAMGYLVRGSHQGEQRGRPRQGYLWDPKSVPGPMVGPGRLDALIGQIVAGAGRHQPKPRLGGKPVPPLRAGAGKVLSHANRMVLSVLLTFADGGGVVRGRGTAELAAMSGLRRGQFDSNVAKLTGLGFIRRYVPGASGKPLIGVAPGTYFLNLGHPEYGDRAVPGVAYAFLCAGGLLEYPSRRYGDIERLMRAAKGSLELIAKYERQGKEGKSSHAAGNEVKAQRPLIELLDALPLSKILEPQLGLCPDTDLDRFQAQYPEWFEGRKERPEPAGIRISFEVLKKLAEVLATSQRQELGNYLQHLLESYASWLLTEHGQNAGAADMAELQGRAYKDLASGALRKSGADSLLTVEAVRLLANQLAQRSVSMAIHCWNQIELFVSDGKGIPSFANRPDSYVILPATADANADHMVVVASSNDPGLRGQGSWLFSATGENYSGGKLSLAFDVVSVESCVDKEKLYRFGVISRPKENSGGAGGSVAR